VADEALGGRLAKGGKDAPPVPAGDWGPRLAGRLIFEEGSKMSHQHNIKDGGKQGTAAERKGGTPPQAPPAEELPPPEPPPPPVEDPALSRETLWTPER
jgi:hypothetical protein